MNRLDEADRVREGVIQWQRRVIWTLLGAALLGLLAAVLGGPASLQALQAVQSFAGLAGGAP